MKYRVLYLLSLFAVACTNEETDVVEQAKGLYYNINKKRKEGRPMRKKGEKGAPKAGDFERAAQTAKS